MITEGTPDKYADLSAERIRAIFRLHCCMKDSGSDRIGEVPKCWEVWRLKRVARLSYGDSLASEARQTGNVDVYGSNGIIDTHSSTNTHLPCIIIGRKGSFGQIHYSENAVFAIDTTFFIDDRTTSADLRWLFYTLKWLRLDDISKDSAVPGLNREDAYERFIPVPSISEQNAIVRYLDNMDRRVQRLTQAKRKLAMLLTEQKQAIIHQAITRGLDPSVTIKDSKIQWLGKIPAHWKVQRTKFAFFRIVGGSTPSSNEPHHWGEDHVWVTPTDISKTTHIQDSQRRLTQTGLDSCSAELLPGGSIVISSRAPVGNVALVEVPFCTNQGCKALVLRPEQINPAFALYLFGTLKTELQSLANGTTFAEISTHNLGNVRIPLPPLSEQAAIVEYLDQATADIDAAITRTDQEIGLLEEYRTRLIADVVTGKLDVREAPASLPEVDPLEKET